MTMVVHAFQPTPFNFFAVQKGDLVIHNGPIYTCAHDLTPLLQSAIVVRQGKIVFLGQKQQLLNLGHAQLLDAQGGAIMPGLIDAHTHLVYAGNRVLEFEQKSRGVSYQQIAQSGGGIWNTVTSTRAMSEEQLCALSWPRLQACLAQGVTTIEIKSGYGLDLENERKILRVAKQIGQLTGVHVRTTFLGAHMLPPDYPESRAHYVQSVCEWMHQLHQEKLIDAVDVFVDKQAFSPEEATLIIEQAQALELGVHLHVDQLQAASGAEFAARMGVWSADHLEYTTHQGAQALADAQVVAVLLPWSALFVGQGHIPPVQALRAYGCKMAVATDFNPGSSPVVDLLSTGALAIGYFKMNIEEVVLGMTHYAACALGVSHLCGVLKTNIEADILILKNSHPGSLFYELGLNPIKTIMVGGQIKTCTSIDTHER